MTNPANPFPADAWAALMPIVSVFGELGIAYYVGRAIAY
jgi:hypothetical protein